MNVLSRLETNCKTVAKGLGFTTIPAENIYARQDSPDGDWQGSQTKMPMPRLIFSAERSNVIAPNVPSCANRTRRCRLTAIVQTQRDDESDETHRNRCAEIFDCLQHANFRSMLDQSDNLTVMLLVARDQSDGQRDRYLESTLEMDVDCVGAKVN